MATYIMNYGTDTLTVTLGQPSDDIRVDGESLGIQCGNRSVEGCMQRAARDCWGRLFATRELAEDAGYEPDTDEVTIWEDVAWAEASAD